jgi:hypothetical protein
MGRKKSVDKTRIIIKIARMNSNKTLPEIRNKIRGKHRISEQVINKTIKESFGIKDLRTARNKSLLDIGNKNVDTKKTTLTEVVDSLKNKYSITFNYNRLDKKIQDTSNRVNKIFWYQLNQYQKEKNNHRFLALDFVHKKDMYNKDRNFRLYIPISKKRKDSVNDVIGKICDAANNFYDRTKSRYGADHNNINKIQTDINRCLKNNDSGLNQNDMKNLFSSNNIQISNMEMVIFTEEE